MGDWLLCANKKKQIEPRCQINDSCSRARSVVYSEQYRHSNQKEGQRPSLNFEYSSNVSNTNFIISITAPDFLISPEIPGWVSLGALFLTACPVRGAVVLQSRSLLVPGMVGYVNSEVGIALIFLLFHQHIIEYFVYMMLILCY